MIILIVLILSFKIVIIIKIYIINILNCNKNFYFTNILALNYLII
jgi:hypothetical protein